MAEAVPEKEGMRLFLDEIRNAGIVWISRVDWAPAAPPKEVWPWPPKKLEAEKKPELKEVWPDEELREKLKKPENRLEGWVKRLRRDAFYDPRDRDASVSIRDHGLLYGGAIFEGINFDTRDGKTGILLLKEHVDRMYEGAKTLGIKIEKLYSKEEFEGMMLETVRRSGLKVGYIRPVLTRGVGVQRKEKDAEEKKEEKIKVGLGINAPCEDPTLFIYVCPPPSLFKDEDYNRGLCVVAAPNTRISRDEKEITHLKWTDYAINTETKTWANTAGFGDAFMMVRMTVETVPDADGGMKEIVKRYLSEATAANVFFVDEKGVLHTPSLDCNCLSGVSRSAIIKLAEEKDLKVLEGCYTMGDLLRAKEIFETGTAAGVIAVTRITGQLFSCGSLKEAKETLQKYWNPDVKEAEEIKKGEVWRFMDDAGKTYVAKKNEKGRLDVSAVKMGVGDAREGPVTKMLREAYFNEVVPKNLTPVSQKKLALRA